MMKGGSSFLGDPSGCLLQKTKGVLNGSMTVHMRLTLFARTCRASYKHLRGRRRVIEVNRDIKVDVPN